MSLINIFQFWDFYQFLLFLQVFIVSTREYEL